MTWYAFHIRHSASITGYARRGPIPFFGDDVAETAD
jgi:hypothetical protein